jgi:hypothetical protein
MMLMWCIAFTGAHLAVAHPPNPLPPQLYANQRDDDPDHPDRQTCNLAGNVGHYRCCPRRPCRQPCPTEEINITPQCTLPVSVTNKHDHNVFSWDQEYDGWFECNNAAAANAAAAALACCFEQDNNANAAANPLADLPLGQPDNCAGSPQLLHSSMPGLETAPPSPLLLQEQNLLDPLPPHRAKDWQVRVRENAPSPTADEMVLWNTQAVHVPAGGSHGAAGPTYALQADDVVFLFRLAQEYT